MLLRNGKTYLNIIKPRLSPHIQAIIALFKKYINVYDVKNNNNKKNITIKEYVNQQIRDYRELFYLIEYYFESITNPTFSNFIITCKNKVNILISQLNEILNRSGKIKGFILTGQDKINAKGLLHDLRRFLQM